MRRLLAFALLLAPLALQAQQRAPQGAAPRTPPLRLSQLTWFDRAGRSTGTLGPLGDHGNFELSTDGSHVASAVTDRARGTRDIWVYDTRRNTSSRFTNDAADENWMIWSPDGLRAIHNFFGEDGLGLLELSASGTGPKRTLPADGTGAWPVSWSPDGKNLLYVTNGAGTGNDIWVLPLDGSRRPYPFRNTEASENWAAFSPDGKWVVFSSDEDGDAAVFVAPFPGPGSAVRISSEQGTQARWRKQDEILYLDADHRIVSVPVSVMDGGMEHGRPFPLFSIKPPYGSYHAFDVSADGKRILVNTQVLSGEEESTTAALAGPAPRPAL